jgi:hypothetical protein
MIHSSERLTMRLDVRTEQLCTAKVGDFDPHFIVKQDATDVSIEACFRLSTHFSGLRSR